MTLASTRLDLVARGWIKCYLSRLSIPEHLLVQFSTPVCSLVVNLRWSAATPTAKSDKHKEHKKGQKGRQKESKRARGPGKDKQHETEVRAHAALAGSWSSEGDQAQEVRPT